MEGAVAQALEGIVTTFLQHGLIGTVALALFLGGVYLYREMKTDRKLYAEEIAAMRLAHQNEIVAREDRHTVEIAQERKLNAELQAERVKELRLAIEASAKSADSLESVTEQYQVLLEALERERRERRSS